MIKKRGFTLIELVLVIIISSSILTTIYSIMTVLPKVKNFNDARQNLIQQTHDIMNRFTILFQDYSIDYEEYFNRMMVGCSENKKGARFERNVSTSGFCENFTSYGNENAKKQTAGEEKQHYIQYCSSDPRGGQYGELINKENCQIAGSQGAEGAFPTNNNGKLSYGQYKYLFRDVKNDTDTLSVKNAPREVGDSDDRDLGTGPQAIRDPENVQELYLISHDKSRRLYLRRFLKTYKDIKGETTTGYTIQMLKLRSFDAGEKHAFNAMEDNQVYDGQIDTWACDYGQQFRCEGAPIPLYAGYHLPKDENDGWVDLFDDNLSIAEWNIQIAPLKDPEFAWAEENQQINPFIQISLTAKLNDHLWANKLGGDTKGFFYSLQNTYNTKGFYLK